MYSILFLDCIGLLWGKYIIVIWIVGCTHFTFTRNCQACKICVWYLNVVAAKEMSWTKEEPASILILLDAARGAGAEGRNTSENFFQFPADYTHLCPEIPANIQCTIFALFLLLKTFQHNFPIYNLWIVKYILFYGKLIKLDTDPLNVYI